jgi:hypothetical protein
MRESKHSNITARIVRAADMSARPWSGGITTQLTISPSGASPEKRDFDYRVSTASVTSDGAFTRYPGYKRILALISGAGMKLQIDGDAHVLQQRFNQISFSGDASTYAELSKGEIHDFNIIFRPNVIARLTDYEISPPPKELRFPEISDDKNGGITRRVDLVYSPHIPFQITVNSSVTEVGAKDLFELNYGSPATVKPVCSVRSFGAVDSILVVSLVFSPREMG